MMKCCLCDGPMYRGHATLSRGTITVHRWCFFMLQTNKEFESFILGMDVDKGKQYRAEWDRCREAREMLRAAKSRRTQR